MPRVSRILSTHDDTWSRWGPGASRWPGVSGRVSRLLAFDRGNSPPQYGQRGDWGVYRTVDGERRFYKIGGGGGADASDNGGSYGVKEHAVAKFLAKRVAGDRGVSKDRIDEVSDAAAHHYLRSGGKGAADMHRAVQRAAGEVATRPKPPPTPEPETPHFDEAKARAFAEQAHAKVLEIGRRQDEKAAEAAKQLDAVRAERDRLIAERGKPKSKREGNLTVGQIDERIRALNEPEWKARQSVWGSKGISEKGKAADAAVEALSHPDGPASFTYSYHPDLAADAEHRTALQPELTRGFDAFRRLAGKGSPLEGRDIKVGKYQGSDNRAEATGGRINLARGNDASVVAHELGHELEFASPQALKESLKFRDSLRTSGEKVPLKQLKPNSKYRDEEVAFPGKYSDPYVGKDYGGYASEVTSMGLTHLLSDPVDFARNHPEHFKFTLMQLHRR